ncbi:MAG: hypothetical protein K2M11_04200 [Paramuribaculum sp.]|nr:hypothetical protein [Paramuribaculum sp.]
MISRKHILLIRCIAAAMLVVLLPALYSCGAFNEPEHPCPDPDADAASTVAIEFRVHTTAELVRSRSFASRADSNGDHSEESSDNAQIEDYISLADLGVFIFGDRPGETDPVLLYENTKITDQQYGFSISGSIGDYTISLTLPADVVASLLGTNGTFSPLSPSGTRNLKLTVAMLANIDGNKVNTSDFTAFDNLKAAVDGDLTNASKLSDFNELAEALEFTASNSAANMLIPMYGISSFTLSESDMFYSRPDSRIELGDISMLRAMMKVRVVDNIANKNDEGYPKITRTQLFYKSVTGYVTPPTPGSYVNGTQIHNDRIAQTDGTKTNTVNMRVGTVVENSFVGCAPVQSLISYYPSLAVYVQPDAGSAEQRFDVDINNVRFPGITGDDMWGTTMLRNHVYTLRVDNVNFGASLTLTATVADWDDAPVFEFDYSDDVSTVGEEGKITWKQGTYANIIDNTTLIMNPWHDGKSVPAECTFGLATPVGALWTASLIMDEGDAGAFLFVDEDGNPLTDEAGNELTAVEGRIDGKLATLRIATRTENPDKNNRVHLQIVVVTQGGNGYSIATDGKILLQWSLVQNQQQ